MSSSESYDPRRPYYPYRGPINRPCSACSAGDTKIEHHDHDYVDLAEGRERRYRVSLKPYTLDDLEHLAREWFDSFDPDKIDVTDAQLTISLFVAWARKREREVGE